MKHPAESFSILRLYNSSFALILGPYLREAYLNLNNLLRFSCEPGSYALWLAALVRSQQY